MLDAIFYWLGATVAGLGAIGLTALVALWAVEWAVKAAGTYAIIMKWYVDKLKRERVERNRG